MDLNYQLSWHQLAHRLIDDLIHSPDAGLPGIQAMRRQYRVTRLTAERALRHLEELGVVEPAQLRKKRQVNLSKLQSVASSQGRPEKRIFFISDSPASNLPYMARDIYGAMHTLCEREGYSLDYIQFPARAADLRSLLISLQPRGVILYTIPPRVAEVVFSLNIPAVGIGVTSSRIPTFNSSHTNLLVCAFKQAYKAGHHSITMPIWKTQGSLYEKLAEKLEKAFSGSPIHFSRRYNLPFIEGETKSDYHEALRGLFRYTPPTCIILPGISQYLTAVSFFLKEGLRIPDDISVIILSQDPLLEDIVPSIAHFTLYSDDMVRRAFHALQEQMSGLQSPEETELIPIWVPGDSLATLKSR